MVGPSHERMLLGRLLVVTPHWVWALRFGPRPECRSQACSRRSSRVHADAHGKLPRLPPQRPKHKPIHSRSRGQSQHPSEHRDQGSQVPWNQCMHTRKLARHRRCHLHTAT
ncbi:hypothetical protein AK812_SmicGene49084 [Symbiodinium microadriaticum]|uniref:Secreted protein n=1 Tax=Symbiodinium microadriaticum TaxID=2951 RepID=A0A1Q9E3X7_SYMMI|nr:hypothetical protein AK812_SmicGene49084 [Symbiodinium microadriaticum]